MEEFFQIIPIILTLIFLEGILSIDNAAVLGAMVAHLPREESIPWPRWLRPFVGGLDRILGPQQDAALKVGLLGAYLGRGLMLFLAAIIAENPLLLGLGAAYLFWLAINHFADVYTKNQTAETGAAHTAKVSSQGFWMTVLLIEIADLAFSLDNVVVAISLDKRFWVIALGVGIGIVVMRFAAAIFTRLIEWEPNLEHAAFALLLAIGTETLVKLTLHLETPHALKFTISMVILVLTIALSRVSWLGGVKTLLKALLPVAYVIQSVVKFAWKPIGFLFGLLVVPFKSRNEPQEIEVEAE